MSEPALRRLRAAAALALACASLAAYGAEPAAEEEDEAAFDPWYAGASATLVLPQGGHSMRRLGGATARVGYYLLESFALEADAAWLETCAGLGLQFLWHFYGYERFDPFVTFGARGWISGDAGPCVGLGAFYHLTDNWSLRADAQATLGVDGAYSPWLGALGALDFDHGCRGVYTLSLGIQRSF